jgi:hypothetical protein
MRAIAANNSKYCATCAVPRVTCSTEITISASGIYFPDNSLSGQAAASRIFDNSDKLVTDCSLEASVATRNLEIGIANTGKQHAHQDFLATFRDFNMAKSKTAFLNAQGFH